MVDEELRGSVLRIDARADHPIIRALKAAADESDTALPEAQVTVLLSVDGVGVVCSFALSAAEEGRTPWDFDKIVTEWVPVPLTTADQIQYYIINNRVDHG